MNVIVRRQLIITAVCVVGAALTNCDAVAADYGHALFRAIVDRDDVRVESLLRQGTPVDVRTAEGTTPLLVAALNGTTKSVEMLLARGADPNIANDRGVTPLLYAVSVPKKAQLLVDHGGNVNARSALGNTPLLVASALPNGSPVVEVLLANGAELTARNGRGRSALTKAIGAGSVETVQLLLARADQSQHFDAFVRGDATSLIESAAIRGSLPIATLVYDRIAAANGDSPPNAGQAINVALLTQSPEVACALLDRGVDVTTRKQPGNVPTIVLAAYSETGDTSVLQALIRRGIDVTATNKHDETALTWARRRGHDEMIKLLTEANAPEQRDELPAIPSRNINLHTGNQQKLLTSAVGKSIALLQRSSDVFLEKRKTCVSCHHQNLPGVAIGWARDRGLPVDQASIDRMVHRHTNLPGGGQTFIDRCYQVDNPAPVPPRLFGWGLWGLSELGHPPSEWTDAIVWYLAATQDPNGSWSAFGSMRPPMGGSDFTATVLAMRVLQLYPTAGRADELRDRVEMAAKWLQATPTQYHQQRAFQLLGLGWAGRSPDELADFASALLDEQNDDGGWSQLANLPSDAWATGQTLVALHVAGGVRTNDPAYQRGLRFLLSTQFDDGSWFVKSRTWPFQPPFDSEFPFERDQWISAAATAWAVMAMTLAIEPGNTVVVTKWDNDAPPPTDDRSKSPPVERVAETASVDFVRHIKPILESSCVACHSGDEPKGNLDMTRRAPLLEGGETGLAAIVPGLSDESLMYVAVSNKDSALQMPPPDKRADFASLSPEQVRVLKRWIDTGANWPSGLRLKAAKY